MDTFQNIQELIDLNNIECIQDYIISEDEFEFEKKSIESLILFEQFYKDNYLEYKYNFYKHCSLFKESKFNFNLDNNIIEDLINIDIEDSIKKFGFIQNINYFKLD